MIDFPAILRGAGFTVSEVPGWRTNSHPGDLTPVGGMWHHTTALNDLETLVRGRPGISGPLCNLWLRQDATWVVVSGGHANHAGPGNASVLENLRHGIVPKGDAAALGLKDDGGGASQVLVGIEVEGGVNDQDDFPAVQLDMLVAGSAVLCTALGFTANHWIHHREWTSRKPDMAHRGDLRARVAATLSGAAQPRVPVVSTSGTQETGQHEVVLAPQPAPVPKPEDVMYVVIEAPDRSPAFFTTDGVGHAMGKGGWTFINRFATKHPGLVIFDSSWSSAEYDMVVRLPAHSVDEPIDPGQLPPGIGDDPFGGLGGGADGGGATGGSAGGGAAGGGVDITLPPDLIALPDDVPEPSVGTFG